MKFLITGSNGLLGQRLLFMICSTIPEARVLACARGANLVPEIPCAFASLDITDADACRQVITQFQPDVLINCAALTNADFCEANPAACEDTNVRAVQHLAEICRSQGTHLIHLSTDFVFGGVSGPYREDDLAHPLSVYGRSKLASEQIVLDAAVGGTVVRTCLVYGTVPYMTRSNVVLWVKASLEKGKVIQVVNDQWRTPTYIDDLASACIALALTGQRGLFHISGAEEMSIYELAIRVATFLTLDQSLILPVNSASLNEVASRPPHTGFIIEKARHLLGFSPCSLEEGLFKMF